MTRRQETGMAIIVLVVIYLLVLMSSCSTKKTVTEYVTIHDTLISLKTDTVKDITYKVKVDTVREVTIREITLLKDSDHTDTVRIDTFNEHYRYIYVGDSTFNYRSAVDTLLNAIHQNKEKEVIKTVQKTPWWDKALFLLVMVGLCIIVLKSRME